ncbi:MAG: histidinol-phosphate transaminase [Eubacteriales bacterium]|nr:histidinol-phosphate transaminase [Eubacteriales bacterium]
MSRFLDERYAKLLPYVPGEQPQNRQYIKLNTNENPYPPSPAVLAALNREEAEALDLYPDTECTKLRRAIAACYGIEEAQIVVTNGSDEALAFAFLAFCGEKTGVCFADITYGFYPVFAELFCLSYNTIPLNEDFSVDPTAYYNAGKTVVIANPNAPTGMALTAAAIEQVLQHNKNNLVIVDEAYVDFGAESVVPLIEKYDNLLVIQTFSKSRSLAGIRLGAAIGCKALIEDMNKMKFSFNPYNVNRLAIAAGAAAMEDAAYFTQCVGAIKETRAWTAQALTALGFTVLPSFANFLFAKPSKLGGEAYYLALKERGVLVRHFNKARISEYVRITIGTKEQMEALVSQTKDIIGGIA